MRKLSLLLLISLFLLFSCTTVEKSLGSTGNIEEIKNEIESIEEKENETLEEEREEEIVLASDEKRAPEIFEEAEIVKEAEDLFGEEEEITELKPYEQEDFFDMIFNSTLKNLPSKTQSQEEEENRKSDNRLTLDDLKSGESPLNLLEAAQEEKRGESRAQSLTQESDDEMMPEEMSDEAAINAKSELPDAIINPKMNLLMFQLVGMFILIVVLFASAFALRVVNKGRLPLWFSIVVPILFTLLSIVLSLLFTAWTWWYLSYLVLLLTYFVLRRRGKNS